MKDIDTLFGYPVKVVKKEDIPEIASKTGDFDHYVLFGPTREDIELNDNFQKLTEFILQLFAVPEDVLKGDASYASLYATLQQYGVRKKLVTGDFA